MKRVEYLEYVIPNITVNALIGDQKLGSQAAKSKNIFAAFTYLDVKSEQLFCG